MLQHFSREKELQKHSKIHLKIGIILIQKFGKDNIKKIYSPISHVNKDAKILLSSSKRIIYRIHIMLSRNSWMICNREIQNMNYTLIGQRTKITLLSQYMIKRHKTFSCLKLSINLV